MAKKEYHIDCLAIADDIVFLAKDIRIAVAELEKLQEITERNRTTNIL